MSIRDSSRRLTSHCVCRDVCRGTSAMGDGRQFPRCLANRRNYFKNERERANLPSSPPLSPPHSRSDFIDARVRVFGFRKSART